MDIRCHGSLISVFAERWQNKERLPDCVDGSLSEKSNNSSWQVVETGGRASPEEAS
jgi:hypothetical protein